MRCWKKIAEVFLVLSVLFSLVGCREEGDPLDYQNGNIAAEIIICKNGVNVSGVLNLGAQNGNCPRDASLLLTSPDSVRGIKIRRVGGEVRAEVGEHVVTAPDILLYVAELFSLDGAVTSASAEKINGVRITKITVDCGGKTAEVTLSENGTPLKISSDELTVEIVSFESN